MEHATIKNSKTIIEALEGSCIGFHANINLYFNIKKSTILRARLGVKTYISGERIISPKKGKRRFAVT